MEITYEMIKRYNTLLQIAIVLGFCGIEDTKERKLAQTSRVCNWARTGIPERILAKKDAQLKTLLEAR